MKRNGKKSRKIRKLILACTLSAVVLIVSTYTWFIGIQTVRVSPFEITIATTEGLFLSMDGKSWVYNLDINDDTPVYTGNTNNYQPAPIEKESIKNKVIDFMNWKIDSPL